MIVPHTAAVTSYLEGVVEEGITRSMNLVAAEELILQELPIAAVGYVLSFWTDGTVPVVAVEAEDDRSADRA